MGGRMIRKFQSNPTGWDGVESHVYKENSGTFSNVTKQILFDNQGDLPIQFRYFEVENGGYSSLEHHKHMHIVVIFKGKGHALLGDSIQEVSVGDFIVIEPWKFHQFRADMGEKLGFFCIVNTKRDTPVYPTRQDMGNFLKNSGIAAFMGNK